MKRSQELYSCTKFRKARLSCPGKCVALGQRIFSKPSKQILTDYFNSQGHRWYQAGGEKGWLCESPKGHRKSS